MGHHHFGHNHIGHKHFGTDAWMTQIQAKRQIEDLLRDNERLKATAMDTTKPALQASLLPVEHSIERSIERSIKDSIEHSIDIPSNIPFDILLNV